MFFSVKMPSIDKFVVSDMRSDATKRMLGIPLAGDLSVAREPYSLISTPPKEHGLYVVITEKLYYDMAIYDGHGWDKGIMRNGIVVKWAEIPKELH